MTHEDAERLLTPAEVAAMFGVNRKTVTRWARSGKLAAIRTIGGQRRFRPSDVRSLLAATRETAATDLAADGELRSPPR